MIRKSIRLMILSLFSKNNVRKKTKSFIKLLLIHHNHLILSIECSHTQHNISATDKRKGNCRRRSFKKFTVNGLAEAYADLSKLLHKWMKTWTPTLKDESQHWKIFIKRGMFMAHYLFISQNDEKKKQN